MYKHIVCIKYRQVKEIHYIKYKIKRIKSDNLRKKI